MFTFVNGLGSWQSNTILFNNVSAKHIRSISLLKLSSKIVYFGIYIGSNGSLWSIKSGEFGNNTKSVPLI